MKRAPQWEAEKPVLKLGQVMATGNGGSNVWNSAGTSKNELFLAFKQLVSSYNAME